MNAEKLLSKRLLTTDEMARILNVNVRTVRQMVRRNDIPFIRINRWHIRFDPETIEAWLKSREGIKSDKRAIWDGRKKAKAKRKRAGKLKFPAKIQPSSTMAVYDFRNSLIVLLP